jgi:hypothetical protein
LYQRDRLNSRLRAFLVTEAERIGVSRAARKVGVSRRTVYRWRRRAPDFTDRSCRPQRSPRRCADALEATVLALRLDERGGPDRIGSTLGLHPSTVHRILRRHGAQRLSHLFPKPRRSFGTFAPLRPGELVGIDIKSFGSLERGGGRRADQHRTWRRVVGWQHLHVAIDMASRLVFSEFRPTLGGADAPRSSIGRWHSSRARACGSSESSATTERRTKASPSAMPATPRGFVIPARRSGTPGRTAELSASSARSSASARTATTSHPTPSGPWRSRSSFPGTTATARITRSEASRRKAG